MAHRAQLKITGTLERIPAGDVDSPEFVAWCEANDVHPLGSSRRGWWSALKTYIRDAEYVFHTETGETLLLTQEMLDEMLIT